MNFSFLRINYVDKNFPILSGLLMGFGFFVSYFVLTLLCISGSKAVDILQAYEGTLEDDYPPDNERCEHGEMLLYKVASSISSTCSMWEIFISSAVRSFLLS